MHQVEPTSYGFRITMDGFIKRDDMERWAQDLQKQLGASSGPFGVLVDLRGAVAFPAEAQDVLMQGIQYCLDHGMERSAVVVSNAISKIQAVRIAKEAGIYQKLRHIDSSSTPDWEQVAKRWITDGLTPDE